MADSNGRLSRRELLKLVGLGSAGLVLQACGGAAPSGGGQNATSAPAAATPAPAAAAPADYEKGELKVLVCCYTDAEVELRKKYNEAFETSHPGLKINHELLPAGQNYFEKLQTLIASGTAPDVFDMWEGYVQPYAANGALLNLDPFLTTDPKVHKDQITPAAMMAGSYQNSVYSLLLGLMPGPISVYYNVDHFATAKVKEPTSDWTWDEMRSTAKALTKDTKGAGTPDQWGLIFALWFVPWTYWIWSNGGDIFNADETKCTLDDPKAVQAIQYWADLVNVDKSTLPPSQAAAMGGELSIFQSGQASMYLGNFWDASAIEKTKDLKWKSVLAPRANSGGRTWYLHTTCWSISAQTKMPQASWLYARDFVLGETLSPTTTFVPGLKPLLPHFTSAQTTKLGWDKLVSLADKPDFVRIPGSGAKWDKISGLIQAELDLVFTGEKTAAEAAKAVVPQVDAELARKDAAGGAACAPGCSSTHQS